jgi:hypothetical protein
MHKACFILFVVIFGLAGAVPSVYAQNNEELTVTTYYPSPMGSYNNLTVADTLHVTSAVAGAGNSYNGPGIVFNFPSPGPMARNDAGIIRAFIPASDDFELQLMVSDNINDRVYIGGSKGGLFGGTPGGLTVRASGDARLANGNAAGPTGANLFVSGSVLERSPAFGQGCIRMSYGGNSGLTECPPGTTFNSWITAPSRRGGQFYCCQ